MGVPPLAKRIPLLNAAILALPLFVSSQAPAWAADDERPDLKIELVNAPIPIGARELQLRVTNVSAWWADATSVHVETRSRASGNAEDFQIENLDPGQSTMLSFTLAVGCSGNIVRAEIAPASNYEGKKESNLDNNRLQADACGAQQPGAGFEAPVVKTAPPSAAAAAAVIETQIEPGLALNDSARSRAILAPRVVTVTFIPNASAVSVRSNFDAAAPARPTVGWYQDPDYDTDYWRVDQLAVNFDLRFLQQVPGTRVREAVLRYAESYSTWQDNSGNKRGVGNCVEVLGRATEEWQGRESATFVPEQFANDKVQGHTPGVREWFVTSEIRDQWIDNVYPPLGFVLRGGNESPTGADHASCESIIDDVTLEITYEVPQ